MKTLFTRNEDKLVFDHVSGDRIYARILKGNGRIFDPMPLDSILARGYWEAVPGVDLMSFIPVELRKEWSEDLHPRDAHGRFTNGADFAGADSFVNPREDKAVQRYLELKKIANGPGVFDGPGAEEYRAAMKDYRNAPQHIVDRAKLAENLEGKLDNVANGFAGQESGMTAQQIGDKLTNDLQQFVNENPVAIQIPFSRLDSILDNGVQSMYETGTRGGKRGEFYQEVRGNAESAFYGYNAENTPAEQRPVYGYVMRPENTPAPEGTSAHMSDTVWDSVGTYGNTTVVLKDSVRDNTTVTVDDSLEKWYTYSDILPTPINNVTPDAFSTGRALQLVEEPNIPFASRPFTYVEAQIHGGVEPSDIAKVILPKEPTKALATKMDNLGITYEVKAQPDSVAKEWSEELHPRDAHGRFGEAGQESNNTDNKPIGLEAYKDLLDPRSEYRQEYKGSVSGVTNKSPAQELLGRVLNRAGFDGKPTLVDSVKDLQGEPIYRGVAALTDEQREAYVEQFKSGDLFVGAGVIGNGTYFSSDKDTAASYAGSKFEPDKSKYYDRIIVAAIKPDANFLQFEDHDDFLAWQKGIYKEANKLSLGGDVSSLAAAKGIDGWTIGNRATDDAYTVVLNRTALEVVR